MMGDKNAVRQWVAQRMAAYSPARLAYDYPQAAVLLALQWQHNELTVLLTRRAAHLRIHPGEIAFPGGKQEPGDSSLLATGLREAQEEINLSSEHFTLLGELDQRATRSNICVSPFVGWLDYSGAWRLNDEEIDTVFNVPLAFLLKPANLNWDHVLYRDEPRAIAWFQYGEFKIWGMTAMVLVNFLNAVFAAGIKPPTPRVDKHSPRF